MDIRFPNQGMLGHPGAIRMIFLLGSPCNFNTTLPNMTTGGKAYGSRSSQRQAESNDCRVKGGLVLVIQKLSQFVVEPQSK